jgi:hypothetical protein
MQSSIYIVKSSISMAVQGSIYMVETLIFAAAVPYLTRPSGGIP